MYASYYTLALIPAGIAFYLFMKLGSDSIASKRPICISGDDPAPASTDRVGQAAFLSAIDATCKRNDGCFVIKGLPIRADELALWTFNNRSMSCSANEKSALKGYVELTGLATMCGDMICTNGQEDCRGLFAARAAYDIFVKDGAFGIGKGRDIAHFLKENRIIADEVVDYGRLLESKRGKPFAVFRLCRRERRTMSASELIFSNGNSLLLMLSNSGLVRVFDC
jgi:hypothetical protein